ncbi:MULTISPECIES: alpha-galactosidase [Paenibacillus]|uniref:alpha-galactosidase n=1 Tax=Paenibacillus TaxID=44249 RepID=UPI000CF91EB4|nr:MULTISPECIES: alpha-galactosidase [Paenibacillus]MBJ9988052.1 alpha-galactosidase [Paenibacillus sp. S28]MEC0176079.1 alpha-galactosidase [Paenibacillus favisporus]PQP87544.1 alpha-glucosidase/alpha-galactosidase [Paenibacillus sp. AR247]GIO58579.1 alpha-glucosidase/alpha-galactosidase [Paenibacillus cineris]
MTKISIIGAGSAFTQDIATDILLIEGIEGGTIALVDIDAERLEIARKLVEKIIELSGKRWNVIASTDRREVIGGSQFVINQIEVGGLQTVRYEYEIPLKYGVNQCIGDTLGPGGLFKTLRTLPSWMDIIRDVEDLCPDSTILNYTNPMSAVTLLTSRVTSIPVVGLCHSIQNTSRQLAKYAGVPYEDMQWRAGGINHMSWFVELTHEGKDLYPVLREKIQNPDLLKKDPVRFDAMKYLGAFVSESSGHFSEYIPYYRKRQSLIDKHCSTGYNGATGYYADNWPIWRKENDEKIVKQLEGSLPIELAPSNEYAAIIIEAMLKNEPKVIYGNVPNEGLIHNLPGDGIVEVACMVDRNGVNPCRFGSLPEHLAALCRSNMAFFDLAVGAVLNNDKEMARHALMVDPLSAAVCSLDEISDMFEELYEAERDFIPVLK